MISDFIYKDQHYIEIAFASSRQGKIKIKVKRRIKNFFTQHSVNQNLEPDIVILYESTFPFNISNKKYIRLKKYNNLVIYKKNNV